MRIVDIKDATHTLAEYAVEIGDCPIIVASDGTPVAALVPIENADLEVSSLSTSREFLELIERSRARVRAEGGLSSEQMRRRIE
jgi:antitoxin (DNA-binding transcriptional repressor) of toxin-antitoxin stability system